MQIEYVGPEGSKLTMDIPPSMEAAFRECDVEGRLTRITRNLAGQFYTTFALALVSDMHLIAENRIESPATLSPEERGLQLMLGRFHKSMQDFINSELPMTNRDFRPT